MRAQEGQHARPHKEEMGGQGIEQGVGGSKLVILIIGMMGCGWGERREWNNKKRAEKWIISKEIEYVMGVNTITSPTEQKGVLILSL